MTNWISVNDRLPETPDKGFGCKSDRVLVYVADQREGLKVHFGKLVAFEDGGHDWMITGNSGAWCVTHWMPLPDNPANDALAD